MPRLFIDRFDAGRKLAVALNPYRQEPKAQILALPRGGVAVGLEVAKALRLPLDVFIARKIGHPDNPEFGIGAVAQGGIIVLDQSVLNISDIPKKDLEDAIIKEATEIERRLDLYRGNRHDPHVQDECVILVDDGLATGVTAIAAARSLKLARPSKLVLAVPVAASDSLEKVRAEFDDIVCLHAMVNFIAVGLWYEQFNQLTDTEVTELLCQAHREIKLK